MPASRNLLLHAWLAMALALQVSDGLYAPLPLALMVVAWTLVALAARQVARGETADGGFGDRDWGVALAVALGAGFSQPPAMYLAAPWFTPLWQAAAGGLLALLVLAAAVEARRSALLRLLFVAGLALGLGLRLAVLIASPAPIIDVFPMFQESARNLLAGLDPYLTPVSDAYGGTRDYGYHILGYAYLPLNLWIQTAFWALTHDIRTAAIAAEALAIAVIWRLGGGSAAARWAILLLLFMPRGIFVIEQAWTEPLIVGAYALATWATIRHPGSRRAAVAYGLLLGLKQYLVYFVLHGLMLERRPGRIVLAAVVVVVPALPFLLWHARAFVDEGLLFQLATPFRPDGLTLSSAVHEMTGLTVGKWLSAVVGLASSLVTFRALAARGPAGWRLGGIVTTFAIFLVGSQAFANYYYLVMAMIVIHLGVTPESSAETTAPNERQNGPHETGDRR